MGSCRAFHVRFFCFFLFLFHIYSPQCESDAAWACIMLNADIDGFASAVEYLEHFRVDVVKFADFDTSCDFTFDQRDQQRVGLLLVVT